MCGVSVSTLDGNPYLSTAFRNALSTVEDSLLSEAWRYIISLENPSISPWIIIFHLINLWYLYTCQRLFGPVTEYSLRWRARLWRKDIPCGSTCNRLSWTLCLGTRSPSEWRGPTSIRCPLMGWTWTELPTIPSKTLRTVCKASARPKFSHSPVNCFHWATKQSSYITKWDCKRCNSCSSVIISFGLPLLQVCVCLWCDSKMRSKHTTNSLVFSSTPLTVVSSVPAGNWVLVRTSMFNR